MLLYIPNVLIEVKRLLNFLLFNGIHVTERLLQTIGDAPRGWGNSVLGKRCLTLAHVAAM